MTIKHQITYLLFYQRTKFKSVPNADPGLDLARIFAEEDDDDKIPDDNGIDSNTKSILNTDPDLDIARRFADDVVAAAADDDDEGINGISNDNVGFQNNNESDEFSPASRLLLGVCHDRGNLGQSSDRHLRCA